MKQTFSKLLFVALVACNFVAIAPEEIEYVDDIDKPIKAQVSEKDYITQELLNAIEADLPEETAPYYKYFADTRIPKGYKYQLNADYTELRDSGITTTNEVNAKVKFFSWSDSSTTIGGSNSTAVHQEIIHHKKRIFSNQFDKLRNITLKAARNSRWSVFFTSLLTGMILELPATAATINDSKSPKAFFITTGVALAISSLVLYGKKIGFYKGVKELDYLQRRNKSDKVKFFECDELEREYNNPITAMNVITAFILSIGAGVAVAAASVQ
jgi:hypothetical protein